MRRSITVAIVAIACACAQPRQAGPGPDAFVRPDPRCATLGQRLANSLQLAHVEVRACRGSFLYVVLPFRAHADAQAEPRESNELRYIARLAWRLDGRRADSVAVTEAEGDFEAGQELYRGAVLRGRR